VTSISGAPAPLATLSLVLASGTSEAYVAGPAAPRPPSRMRPSCRCAGSHRSLTDDS
jgi:hypothetical protein